MDKAVLIKTTDGAKESVVIKCPACQELHTLIVRNDSCVASAWVWNRSLSAPTFTPSLLVTSTRPVYDENFDFVYDENGKMKSRPLRCHSYITDGKIEFLADCAHDLAGQTVELPEFTWNLP